MGISLCLDRFEGREKELAVLVDDEGRQVVVPRVLLPEAAAAGWMFDCGFEHNPVATTRLADEVRATQAELRKTDPGGDIRL